MSVGSVLPHFCVHIKINVRIHARARWPRKTLDWGKKRGGNTEGAPTKDVFSCNSVCSIGIVSLRYGWTGPTDKLQKCLQKQKCFGTPKHFCVLDLKIQNNLYLHSIYKLSIHSTNIPLSLTWTFRTPPLINSLNINSVFINRAEHHGFLLTTTKIRVVPDIPWCWEARLQWPSFDPRQILCFYWSHTDDRAYRSCVICRKKSVLLGKS